MKEKRMKGKLCLITTVLLLTVILAGCGEKAADNPFTADNEIFTYEKIDPEKTQLVVARIGNIDIEDFCEIFEAQNPDIQIIYQDITGGNQTTTPVIDWVKNGYAPDIMISTTGFFTNEDTAKYFENLSANPIIQNYETAALQRTATDSNIYWLPGPSSIYGMIYNKTLFEKYGWQVPATFDEFVDLCLQIREDSNGTIEPWNPNAKYDNELTTALQAITYEELFGGADNRSWYNDLLEGQATLIEHMEPFYDMLQTLIDNDILREEHFTYSATTRGQEFSAGKIAMINMILSDYDNEQYDFSYMPFPTTEGELGYICDSFSCLLGLPIKEHSSEQQAAIDRFAEFFSSVEGQQAFIGNSAKISNVKNVPLNQSADLAALEPAISAGHMFEKLDFHSDEYTMHFNYYQDALDMAAGAKTGAECLAASTVEPKDPAGEATVEQPEVVATAPANMTILETSFCIADAYREKAGADIALIANNEAFRGNLMRIFAGDITPSFISVLKPRSFANDAQLIKVTMTGEQLTAALNNPPGYNDTVSNCVYAYSGLKCEVAPWNNLGEKYLSVALADGTAINPDQLYTAAIWAGTVADQYITEVVESYAGTFEEIMTAQMKADGTVAAANDDRIKLVWE